MTKTTRSKSAKESEAAASTRCEQKARQAKDKINWRKECKHPYVCDNEETCTLPREGNIAIYYPNADPNGPDGWHQHDYTARIINIHVINGIRPSDGGYSTSNIGILHIIIFHIEVKALIRVVYFIRVIPMPATVIGLT